MFHAMQSRPSPWSISAQYERLVHSWLLFMWFVHFVYHTLDVAEFVSSSFWGVM